jgi:NAD(P)-dependent dehydrogenase (short-subunit alcohol dehydrogenase family)
MAEINLLDRLPVTKRDPKARAAGKTEEDRRIAKQFGRDFFDGDRRHGYGGYRYDGRWLSVARRFVELGAQVVICGRRAEVLAAAAAELGPAVTTERCDVRDHAAVEAMLDRIWAAGPLDVLVNNAAGNFLAQTHRLSPRAVDAVLDIVLKGSAWCTLGAGRRWIDAGRGGTVLSILTLSALQGGAFTVPSAMASRSALCVRGVARLISSASTTFAKTGPFLNSKASRSRW